jgi:hypothetical protein
MYRFKATSAAIFASLAVTGVTAGPAAASWFVSGTELTGTAGLAASVKVDQNLLLLEPSIGLAIECSGATLDSTNSQINAGNTGQAGSLAFLGCRTVKPETGCSLGRETITSEEISLRAILESKAPEDRIVVSPKTKNVLAEILFIEGNPNCQFKTRFPVPLDGALTLGAPTGQTEETAQALVGLGTVENNSLELGSSGKIYLDGKVLLALASGSKWSFR